MNKRCVLFILVGLFGTPFFNAQATVGEIIGSGINRYIQAFTQPQHSLFS